MMYSMLSMHHHSPQSSLKDAQTNNWRILLRLIDAIGLWIFLILKKEPIVGSKNELKMQESCNDKQSPYSKVQRLNSICKNCAITTSKSAVTNFHLQRTKRPVFLLVTGYPLPHPLQGTLCNSPPDPLHGTLCNLVSLTCIPKTKPPHQDMRNETSFKP